MLKNEILLRASVSGKGAQAAVLQNQNQMTAVVNECVAKQAMKQAQEQ